MGELLTQSNGDRSSSHIAIKGMIRSYFKAKPSLQHPPSHNAHSDRDKKTIIRLAPAMQVDAVSDATKRPRRFTPNPKSAAAQGRWLSLIQSQLSGLNVQPIARRTLDVAIHLQPVQAGEVVTVVLDDSDDGAVNCKRD